MEAADMTWRTSTYTNGGENCIEVGSAPRMVAVRDTKERYLGGGRTVLSFAPETWAAFVAALR